MASMKMERFAILFLFSNSTCSLGMEGKTEWDVISLLSSTSEIRPDSPYSERRSLRVHQDVKEIHTHRQHLQIEVTNVPRIVVVGIPWCSYRSGIINN